MRNYFESPSDAREKLLLIDTVLLAEPSSNESPAPYTLTAYIFKKNDSPICFLQWMLTSSKSEFFCGPLDMVRVEWSGEYASYYLSEGDGNISTVKSREYDAVCFNVEDDKLNKGKYSYGTLSLTPEMPGTLDFTCKYVHTYLNYFTDGFSPSSLDILRRSEMQISSTAYIP